MARIGLWGGSFNPPTIAHKALADFAFETLSLDALWWIVSPQNPLKDIRTLAPFEDRLAMVRGELADRPHMQASDLEQHLGSSFTRNTVAHIHGDHPDDLLLWFMGADNWQNFHLWGDERAKIFDHASIVVLQRPGYGETMSCPASAEFQDRFAPSYKDIKTPGSWTVLENPTMDVAATVVRAAIARGEEHPHITEKTWLYIKEHGLYGSGT